jgi:acetyl-CoA carboxylase biotin carboxyl carrier protein
MTEGERELEAMARAAADLLPKLTERLGRHGLGEIEVARGDLRLRVSGTPARPGASSATDVSRPATAGSPPGDAHSDVSHDAAAHPPAPVGVLSPAVGFFVYADGLGPGQAVTGGDPLGYVEMLGVRHDVRAPRGGTVAHLVAESGEAVEYGQVVVELAPADAAQ